MIFHANQTCMCLDPHQNFKHEVETSLSPPVIFLLTIPRRYFFCGSFLFCVCLCYIVLSVSFSLVVTCCENADFLALIYLMVFLYICHFPMQYPGSGVVLDCVDSRFVPPFLLCKHMSDT